MGLMSKVLKVIALAIFIVWLVIPIAWTFSLSFKPYLEWRVAYFWPKNPTLLNYKILFYYEREIAGTTGGTALTKPMTTPLINTLIIVGVSTIIAVLIGFFTAYGSSRYRSPGPFGLYFTLLTRMVPPATFVTPVLVYYRTLGLLDTHLGLILLYAAATVTYSIWIIKGFIDQIPREWEEAALLEGLSPIKVITRVTLPLVKSALVVSGLFIFLMNYSEFLFALVLTTKYDIRTLPVHLTTYVGGSGALYGAQAACGIIASIIPLVIGYVIQKHLITGLTFGMVRS